MILDKKCTYTVIFTTQFISACQKTVHLQLGLWNSIFPRLFQNRYFQEDVTVSNSNPKMKPVTLCSKSSLLCFPYKWYFRKHPRLIIRANIKILSWNYIVEILYSWFSKLKAHKRTKWILYNYSINGFIKIVDINTSREDQMYVSKSEQCQFRNEKTKDRVIFNSRLVLNLERIKIKLRFVKKLFNLEYNMEERKD